MKASDLIDQRLRCSTLNESEGAEASAIFQRIMGEMKLLQSLARKYAAIPQSSTSFKKAAALLEKAAAELTYFSHTDDWS